MGGSRGVGQGTGGPHPTPCKITGGYSFFLRSTGTDHPREAIGPQGSNCISRDSHTPICKIHIDDLKKTYQGPIPCTGNAHQHMERGMSLHAFKPFHFPIPCSGTAHGTWQSLHVFTDWFRRLEI